MSQTIAADASSRWTSIGEEVPPSIATGAPFNVPDEVLDAHPHECIAELRRRTPVWCRTYGDERFSLPLYSIFPHGLAQAIFKHPSIRQFEQELLAARGVYKGPFFEMSSNGMLASNGDVHRRRRQPLARAFGVPVIRRMQPEIRFMVRDLLASATPGVMNVSEEFARSLPALVLCRIMGMPPEDVDMFQTWVHAAAPGLRAFTEEQLPAIDEATAALMEYVKRLLAERRAVPRDDFLTRYLAEADATEDYTAEETYVQIAGMILAGAETTRNSIAVAMSLLLEHPGVWSALCDDAGLIEAAVRETMRFEPVVGSVPRLVINDLELGGVQIPRGAIVSASVLAALRDPDVFARPDEFDIRRAVPNHFLGFGGGPHRCLGEALAVMELAESVRAFVELMPGAKLAAGPAPITGFSGTRTVGDCWIER